MSHCDSGITDCDTKNTQNIGGGVEIITIMVDLCVVVGNIQQC
jgi:hypothetical protein